MYKQSMKLRRNNKLVNRHSESKNLNREYVYKYYMTLVPLWFVVDNQEYSYERNSDAVETFHTNSNSEA